MFAAGTLTLDELIALSDEIVALSRAGVPLDRGLQALSRELPGRLGAAAGAVGTRLEAGQALEDALRGTENLPVSPAYLAVVRAGVRSGRLPVAVEGLATAARQVAQLRRTVGLALIYPALILTAAYVLSIVALRHWIPRMRQFYAELNLPASAVLSGLEWLGANWLLWAPWPPLILLAWLLARWSRGTRMLYRWTNGRGRSRSPRGILALGRLAAFADVLGLLVEHRVPLVEALPLAGDASGDGSLREACRTLAQRLQRGDVTRTAAGNNPPRGGTPLDHARGAGAPLDRAPLDRAPGDVAPLDRPPLDVDLPPLIALLIVSGRNPDSLAAALRRLADSYRTRARERADRLSLYLPLWLTVGVGGTAVALYALLILAPWCRVLMSLGEF